MLSSKLISVLVLYVSVFLSLTHLRAFCYSLDFIHSINFRHSRFLEHLKVLLFVVILKLFVSSKLFAIAEPQKKFKYSIIYILLNKGQKALPQNKYRYSKTKKLTVFLLWQSFLSFDIISCHSTTT